MPERYVKVDTSKIIQKVLEHTNMSAPTLAKRLGVTYQRIFDLQRNRVKKIGADLIEKILDAYPEINKNFLFFGDGEFLNEFTASLPNKVSPTEFMEMNYKIIDMFEKLHSKDNEISAKLLNLLEREESLNDRELRLNEREMKIYQRELELARLSKEN